ncbi:DUF1770-domain-containing protein [Xylona heveae TC161]|uniref:DUF1770-domain-containing protein n=1 Tax=Xylona heveae (strain CBS 132557 / TC161) TaxID=1328760 RepID=A0A165GSQ3_XYLHT|nr:DUF1770-domain-containing protein [Xylona heveae TC161]KZF22548.1 DUF1770-domain-containing protein [Xylona heveae TC161]
MADPAIQLAETIQTASIERHPSPKHDLNPSTTASAKEPVSVAASPTASVVSSEEIPESVLRPHPRKSTLPPLPDLRFEQSFLKSIEGKETKAAVAWVVVRDQVILPLVQGTLWTLLLSGWRYWNRSAKLSGQSVGARIRRWWWGVNNWPIPSRQERKASEVGDFFKAKFGNAGAD